MGRKLLYNRLLQCVIKMMSLLLWLYPPPLPSSSLTVYQPLSAFFFPKSRFKAHPLGHVLTDLRNTTIEVASSQTFLIFLFRLLGHVENFICNAVSLSESLSLFIFSSFSECSFRKEEENTFICFSYLFINTSLFSVFHSFLLFASS